MAAPTVTQSNFGSSTGTTCAATFSSNVASGVRIVVVITKHGTETGTLVTGIADSVGTTYSECQISPEVSGRVSYIWSGLAGGAGANTITVTFGASTSSRIFIYELSNAATVDTTNNGGSTSDSGTSHTSSSSKTPSTDCIGFCANTVGSASPGYAAGSGWAADANNNARNNSQSRAASGSGETGPYTTTASTGGTSAMQFFESPAAGGGGNTASVFLIRA